MLNHVHTCMRSLFLSRFHYVDFPVMRLCAHLLCFLFCTFSIRLISCLCFKIVISAFFVLRADLINISYFTVLPFQTQCHAPYQALFVCRLLEISLSTHLLWFLSQILDIKFFPFGHNWWHKCLAMEELFQNWGMDEWKKQWPKQSQLVILQLLFFF